MFRDDGSEQRNNEMKKTLPPGYLFLVIPVFLSLIGVFVLGQLPWLIGAYNYLQGAPSPLDQSALLLLGSNLTRIAVMISGIIGVVIGLLLSRRVTPKLDVARKMGEAGISRGMYFVLIFWWMLLTLPIQLIRFLDIIVNGYYTSHFLSDLGWYLTAGTFLAFSIPVIVKYVQLLLSASSTSSQVILTETRSSSDFDKQLQDITLKVVYNGPDP
ncbi:MAG: hypothetical protein ACFFEV_06780 [Candidatus Thorarchaeota archaeon]